jgi:hypothetical protein
MKILLVLSLIANVVLGVLYYQQRSLPPIERIILEEKPAKVIREKVLVPVVKESQIKKQKKITREDLSYLEEEGSMASQDYEEAVMNIETAKKDFLTGRLGIPEETVIKEGKLRGEFIRQSNKIYEKSPLGEVSIADRRRILDMEEDLQKKVIQLYGTENWEKFQKYQIQYNKQVIQRVKEDNAPAILMGP